MDKSDIPDLAKVFPFPLFPNFVQNFDLYCLLLLFLSSEQARRGLYETLYR